VQRDHDEGGDLVVEVVVGSGCRVLLGAVDDDGEPHECGDGRGGEVEAGVVEGDGGLMEGPSTFAHAREVYSIDVAFGKGD
jgi:hypothetical protein